MGDRWYGQMEGKLGYKKGSAKNTPGTKRRLKKDIVADIEKLVGSSLPSLDKVTINDLNIILEALDDKG